MLTRTVPALLAAALLLNGCRDEKIRSYRVAKEERRPSPTMPGLPAQTATAPSIHWQKPEGWQEQPARSMRVASFLVTGDGDKKADMAVTTFPGDVGGDFANVNRWRNQIQLPPIEESALAGAVSQFDLPAGKFQLVDLISAEPLLDGKYKARILGAWLKQPERTWFFKLAGESELVGAQRDAFLDFLKSVHFDASQPMTEPSASATMTSMPPMPGLEANAQPQDNSIVWTAPADWTTKPLGQMRRGSFSAGDADVSVTVLGAATNPLLENINRWRRQIALPPLAEADLTAQTTTLENAGMKFTLIDYVNAGNRVIGAILYHGEEAWFFKMSGTETAVAPQKDAFVNFLKTVKAR
jgi:hypothetical protein